MDKIKLQKANALNQKITEFDEALNCFYWVPEIGVQVSLNPRLIIEFDGDGREQQPLPMNMSNTLIEFIISEIQKNRAEAQTEFDLL